MGLGDRPGFPQFPDVAEKIAAFGVGAVLRLYPFCAAVFRSFSADACAAGRVGRRRSGAV